MAVHVLERPAATNPDCKIWWGRAPLIFAHRKAATLAAARVETVDWAIYLDIVRDGAAMIRPVCDAAAGQYGYITGQMDSRIDGDAAAMLPHDQGSGGSTSSGHIAEPDNGDVVYTCPPGFIARLMQADDCLPTFDAGATDRDPPAEVMSRPVQPPYVRKACEIDGMEPAAFVVTAGEFAASTRKTVDFVARAIEPVLSHAA